MHSKPEKALGSPQGTSTPTGQLKLQGRRTFRRYEENKEPVLSPIPGPESDDESESDEELISAQSSNASPNKDSPRLRRKSGTGYTEGAPTLKSQDDTNGTNWMVFTIPAIVLLALLFTYNNNNKQSCSLKDVSKEFPTRTKDFWLSIETALDDIVKFNRPKTVIFLYESQHTARLDKLLDGISEAAKCWIAPSDPTPIRLTAGDLNSRDVVEDYGKVITLYENSLRKSGVMVLRNLDEVPGTVAQAFHSFCDEFNPLVERALFLFTVEVPTYPGNKLKYLEDRLRSEWRDLAEETFYPLLTRITDVVLEIEEK